MRLRAPIMYHARLRDHLANLQPRLAVRQRRGVRSRHPSAGNATAFDQDAAGVDDAIAMPGVAKARGLDCDSMRDPAAGRIVDRGPSDHGFAAREVGRGGEEVKDW